MIVPTVGCIVWYYSNSPYAGDLDLDPHQPFAAIITHVLNERQINVAFWTATGRPLAELGVPLLQDDDQAPDGADYCTWMPYQKGQVAKTEAA